jgi:hypothetical protein
MAQTAPPSTSIDPEVALNDRGEIAFTGVDAIGAGCSSCATASDAHSRPQSAGVSTPVSRSTTLRSLRSRARSRSLASRRSSASVHWPADGSMVSDADRCVASELPLVHQLRRRERRGRGHVLGLINNSSQTALFAGSSLPPTQLAQWNLNIPIRPQISGGGRIVVRDNLDRILAFPFPSTTSEFVAGSSNGFATTGRMPGISRDGNVIAFVGTRNGEGAFVAIRDSSNAWQDRSRRRRGHATPSPTSTRTSAFCVRASGDLFSGMSITVLFGATRSGVSGAYAVEMSAIETSGNVVTARAAVEDRSRAAATPSTPRPSRAHGSTTPSIATARSRCSPASRTAAAGVVRGMSDRDGDGLVTSGRSQASTSTTTARSIWICPRWARAPTTRTCSSRSTRCSVSRPTNRRSTA